MTCCQSLEVRAQAPEVAGAEGGKGDSDQFCFRWWESGVGWVWGPFQADVGGAWCPTRTQTQTRSASPGRAGRRHLTIPRPWTPRPATDPGPVLSAEQPSPRGTVAAAEALLVITAAKRLRASR